MRTLFLAPAMPEDAGNGLGMRIGVFLEALASLGEVEVIVLPVFGDAGTGGGLCRRLGIRPRIVSVSGRADTHFSIVSGLVDRQTRLDAFVRYGKPSVSAYLSVPVLQDIRELIAGRSFELVHVARSYLMPAIDIWSRGQTPIVSVDLDEDDGETHRRIAGLHAARGEDFVAGWLEAESVAFDRLVEKWLPRADLSFISTERESDAIEGRLRTRPLIIGNSVAVPAAVARRPVDRSLLFVGGFGYFPNLDAAYWLLENVLPQLRDRCGKDVSLTMVGRNPPKRLLALAGQSGVPVLDRVDDLAPLYARASIALVPIRAGGGSRIKLLEAAAHQVPILATSAGAENSGFEDGREIWLADTAEAIVEACLAIWNTPGEAMRRTSAAKELVVSRNSRSAMILALRSCFVGHISALAVDRGEQP